MRAMLIVFSVMEKAMFPNKTGVDGKGWTENGVE